MKQLVVFSAFFSTLAVTGLPAMAEDSQTQNTDITHLYTEGNLASTHPLACVSLSEVKNIDTPADIFKGVRQCIEQNKYDDATDLFAIAGAYSKFDAARVTDKSAGQAKSALISETFSRVSEDKQNKFSQVQQLRMTTPETLKVICSGVKKIGMPNYYPEYMILHGMKAFTGNPYENALEKDFNAQEAWQKVLSEYLSCPN
jgi:hypothetical protein